MTNLEHAKKVAQCIFIATDAEVAADVAKVILDLVAEVAAMRPVVNVATEMHADFEHHGRTYFHRRQAPADALSALAAAKREG